MECEHDGCAEVAEYKPKLCKVHSDRRQELKEIRDSVGAVLGEQE